MGARAPAAGGRHRRPGHGGRRALTRFLRCPFCGAALDGGATVRCDSGHAFDRARQGYLNLLPGGRAVARYQGDSAAMVAARQRFLEAGHYDPLADRLCVRAQPVPDLAVLDAGGGTGFYLDRVRARAPDAAGAWIVTDLSKHAARLGARRYPDLDHVVADTKAALPVSTGGAAVVLDVFAPRNPAEFRRVLAPGGLLLVVVPTDRHLAELRGRPGVLDVQPDKHDRLTGTLAPYFAQAGTELVEAGLRLGGPALADLVGMGPGARHVDDAALRDLRASAPAEVTLSVSLLSFRPAG